MPADVIVEVNDVNVGTHASSRGDAKPILWPVAYKRKREDKQLECHEKVSDIMYDSRSTGETQFQLEADYTYVFAENRFFRPITEERDTDCVAETPSLSTLFLED
jgi:hypothetical protein